MLADLPEDLRLFLMQTSILERVNADLADTLTGQGDARARLARLSRLESLLVPLDTDGSDGWFRYHHLVQEYLKDVLARDHADLLPVLHARASRWFADRSFLTEAVRHARLGGDLGSAARLVEEAGGWSLILSGGIGLLRNLLQNFPPETFMRHPRLGISRVYLHIKDGELALARGLLRRIPGTDRPWRRSPTSPSSPATRSSSEACVRGTRTRPRRRKGWRPCAGGSPVCRATIPSGPAPCAPSRRRSSCVKLMPALTFK